MIRARSSTRACAIDPAHTHPLPGGRALAGMLAVFVESAMWDPKGRFVAFLDNQRGLLLWGAMGRRRLQEDRATHQESFSCPRNLAQLDGVFLVENRGHVHVPDVLAQPFEECLQLCPDGVEEKHVNR